MSADVAVVVVTYNSRGVVPDLVDGLVAACGTTSIELVVVDNGSTDGTAELLEERGVRVVRSENNGYSSGINQGVAAVPGPSAILVLNPDVRLEPASVDRLLTTLRETGAGVVVPRIVDPDGRLSRSLRREPTLRRWLGLTFTGHPALSELVTDPAAYRVRSVADWATGAVMLVDRSLHDQLGGWDESFFLYSEETDFSLRARDAGWSTVYTPAAGAMHVGGGSGESATTHTMKILNRVRLYRRRRGTALASVYYALTVVTEARRALLGHRKSWSTLRSLVLPSARPSMLGARDSLLPR